MTTITRYTFTVARHIAASVATIAHLAGGNANIHSYRASYPRVTLDETAYQALRSLPAQSDGHIDEANIIWHGCDGIVAVTQQTVAVATTVPVTP